MRNPWAWCAPVLLMLLVGCHHAPTALQSMSKKQRSEASALNVELGMGYLQQGEMERAKHKLQYALELDSKNPVAHHAMGYFWEQAEEYALAEEAYREGVGLQPKAGEGHNNLGAYYCRRQQFEKADKEFMKAVASPHYLNTAQAYENASLCARHSGDLKKAIHYLEKSVSHDPHNGPALVRLAQYAMEQHDYRKASDYLQQFRRTQVPTQDILTMQMEVARQLQDPVALSKHERDLQALYPTSPAARQLMNEEATHVH